MVSSASIFNRWLATCASAVVACSAHAQTTSPSPSKPAAPSTAASYTSAFEGFKPYTDESIGNWKKANDTTAYVGGWREYARQAQQPENTPPSAPKADEMMPSPLRKAKP